MTVLNHHSIFVSPLILYDTLVTIYYNRHSEVTLEGVFYLLMVGSECAKCVITPFVSFTQQI
jgi:hypothetical protein